MKVEEEFDSFLLIVTIQYLMNFFKLQQNQ